MFASDIFGIMLSFANIINRVSLIHAISGGLVSYSMIFYDMAN